MVEIIWTDTAIQDLIDIGDYISKDSERYAEITVGKLFDSVDILEKFPLSGKMVPEIQNQAIRELIRGNYRIVYQIIDNIRIDILTIHNNARLIGNALNLSEL